MDIIIRQEAPGDYKAVFHLITEAFEREALSDHKEQLLVERLRESNAFIPELSIVAELDGEIVGHILLTRIKIENANDEFESLAIAQISVHPHYHRNGIGGRLIKRASWARNLKHTIRNLGTVRQSLLELSSHLTSQQKTVWH